MPNFVSKMVSRIFKTVTPNNQQQLQGNSTWKFMESFFSWMGSGKRNAFRLYTKSYGENPLVYMIVKKIAFSSASIKRNYLDANGERTETSTIQQLLENPNEHQGEIEFKEEINEYLLTTGNAYVRIIKGEGGFGVELYILCSQKVEIIINSIGEVIRYEYSSSDGKITPYLPEEILHIKTSNIANNEYGFEQYGLSPLQAGWIVVESSTEKLNADASIFKNRGVIGILSSETDTPMLAPERERLQGELDGEMQGAKKFNKIKISTSRLKYIQTGMSPTDLQLLEGILSSLRLLCGLYSMPSVLFNDTASSTYNNVETAKKTAYQDVYIPLANKVDSRLSKWLSSQLDVQETMVVDLTSIESVKATTNEIAQALNSSLPNVSSRLMEVVTLDEAREILGLEGIGGTEGAKLLGQGKPETEKPKEDGK
jgi:HK97 family phage portal protein